MPTAYIKKLAKLNHTTVNRIEKFWSQAKEIAKSEGNGKAWGLITTIFQNKLKKEGYKVKAFSELNMKPYSYKGQIITANSKQEAVQKIVANSKKPKIDMKVVNKWMKKNLDLTDKGLGKDHWKNPKNGEVYYSWEAAKRLAKKVGGYHIPSAEEWEELMKACGGICTTPEYEKATYRDYERLNELRKKLHFKFVGEYNHRSKKFEGGSATYWSFPEMTNGNAWIRVFFTGRGSSFSHPAFEGNGYSIRLVKD